jgi:hypothetical protein
LSCSTDPSMMRTSDGKAIITIKFCTQHLYAVQALLFAIKSSALLA